MTKAQLSSIDAILSMMIFLAAVSTAIFLWDYVPAPDGVRESAENTADYLLMKRLGFENKLDSSLIDSFSAQTHEEMRRALGIPENFYFRIVNMSSSTIKSGGLEPSNATYIANIRRIGALGGEYVYLDTMLWK